MAPGTAGVDGGEGWTREGGVDGRTDGPMDGWMDDKRVENIASRVYLVKVLLWWNNKEMDRSDGHELTVLFNPLGRFQ